MEIEFTERQLERQDLVDNALTEFLERTLAPRFVQWDAELMGELRDAIEAVLEKHLQLAPREFYP